MLTAEFIETFAMIRPPEWDVPAHTAGTVQGFHARLTDTIEYERMPL